MKPIFRMELFHGGKGHSAFGETEHAERNLIGQQLANVMQALGAGTEKTGRLTDGDGRHVGDWSFDPFADA